MGKSLKSIAKIGNAAEYVVDPFGTVGRSLLPTEYRNTLALAVDPLGRMADSYVKGKGMAQLPTVNGAWRKGFGTDVSEKLGQWVNVANERDPYGDGVDAGGSSGGSVAAKAAATGLGGGVGSARASVSEGDDVGGPNGRADVSGTGVAYEPQVQRGKLVEIGARTFGFSTPSTNTLG